MTEPNPLSPAPTQARRPIRGSFIAQFAIGVFLKLHRLDWTTRFRPLFWRLLNLIGKTDRLVRIVVGSTELVIPVTHPLPLERAINPEFLHQFGRIAKAITSLYPSMTAVMINANYGAELAVIRSHTTIPLLGCTNTLGEYLILNRNMLHIENVDTALISDQDTLSAKWIEAHAERYATANWIIYKATGTMQPMIDQWLNRHVILTIEWQTTSDVNLPGLFDQLDQNGYTAAILFDYAGHYVATAPVSDPALLIDLASHLSRSSQPGGTATFFHANHADCLRTFAMEERLLGRRPSQSID